MGVAEAVVTIDVIVLKVRRLAPVAAGYSLRSFLRRFERGASKLAAMHSGDTD